MRARSGHTRRTSRPTSCTHGCTAPRRSTPAVTTTTRSSNGRAASESGARGGSRGTRGAVRAGAQRAAGRATCMYSSTTTARFARRTTRCGSQRCSDSTGRNDTHERAHRGTPQDAREEPRRPTSPLRARRWHDVVEQLTAYLAVADDEGNAWGRLGRALREIGREEEARDAYRKGIEAAARHGHPSMAAEFQEAIDELNELA